MAKHPYGTNTETLLLLAWLSTLDLQAQARKDREAHPWMYPYRPSRDQSQLPAFPEALVREAITEALKCFNRDAIYGPLFKALVDHRLAYCDFPCVARAIELEGVADPSAGLYYSNAPYYSQRRTNGEFANETEVLLQVTTSHHPLADRLRRLSRTWSGNTCCGALELRSFFGWYLNLAAWALQMPFPLGELLRISLNNIDWHVVAANITSHPVREECHCAEEIPLGAIAEYLGELFKATGDEAVPLGQQLPEPERAQALLLADLCRETTKAMRLLLINVEKSPPNGEASPFSVAGNAS